MQKEELISKKQFKTKSKFYTTYFGNGNLTSVGNLVKKNLNSVKKICIICDKKLP